MINSFFLISHRSEILLSIFSNNQNYRNYGYTSIADFPSTFDNLHLLKSSCHLIVFGQIDGTPRFN